MSEPWLEHADIVTDTIDEMLDAIAERSVDELPRIGARPPAPLMTKSMRALLKRMDVGAHIQVWPNETWELHDDETGHRIDEEAPRHAALLLWQKRLVSRDLQGPLGRPVAIFEISPRGRAVASLPVEAT